MFKSAFATGVWMVCKRILTSGYWKLTRPLGSRCKEASLHPAGLTKPLPQLPGYW